MFSPILMRQAERLLDQARARRVLIATAESCTGGLVAALLTSIAGSSDVFERGFVTYSNKAKMEELGVPTALLKQYGSVSEPVARAMAEGALQASQATLSVALTGVAGPGGGTDDKPVGLVHIAAALSGRETEHHECRFGDIGREAVRIASVEQALSLLRHMLS